MTPTAPPPTAPDFALFCAKNSSVDIEWKANALTVARRAWEQQTPFEQRDYKALKAFAISLRLTWNPNGKLGKKSGRYEAPMGDYELERHLHDARYASDLNHLITNRYWIACMSETHRARLWNKAKRIGAGWDGEGKKFI
ncbi:hypothetical protein [Spirosoma sp. KUDC1026]|uniref:hypothetical protein n=1 Tax=Spirosoma sp. KUDC1026 TaxID=2745947 RepID=UPI00159BC907|nr:hypothetical protein [Spirosoma sp. KUDC1026]QKZ15161.1 hypothetical protein HU175_22070 [Spirosoma sp. KUDC1026]